jgi:hypothetical protein
MSLAVNCVSTPSEFRYAKSRTLGKGTNTVGERSSSRSRMLTRSIFSNSDCPGAQRFRRLWADGRPSGSNPLHLSRGTARRPASGPFQVARLATNLPLFPRRLPLPALVTVRSVRVRLSRTIQGPKSQPESCFGRMCLSPEKRPTRPHGFQVFKVPSTTIRSYRGKSTQVLSCAQAQ